MWQNSQSRDAARRQYQGSISRANGLHFEEIIDAGCNYYRVKGAADIEKTPEPMRPIKDMGGGKFLAVYTKAAQADYKGLLAGAAPSTSRPSTQTPEEWSRAALPKTRRSACSDARPSEVSPSSSVPSGRWIFFGCPGMFGRT